MRRALFLVLLMLVAVGTVQAATVQRIAAQNCGFDDGGPLVCGDSTVFSCEISDTTGATSVNEVIYTIGGVEYPATRVSGTQLNGTWQATVLITSEIDSIDGTTFLDYIEITDSAFNTCSSASVEVNTAGCFVNFTSTTSFDSDCGCSYTVTEVCQTNDVLLRQHTPGAGCTLGETVFNTTGVCDFCDPGYQVESFTCTGIDRSSVMPFTGSAEIEFASSNPACCLTTGLDSDCSTPATDGSELICSQGYFIGEYNDVTGSRMNAGTKIVADETSTQTTTLNSLELIGGGTTRQIQPIVFDVDDDGEVEIVAFTNPSSGSGTITVYNQDHSVKQTINTGSTIIGDVGMYEFDARGGFTSEFEAGTNGAGVAIPVQQGATNYVLFYIYESGAFGLEHNLSLTSHDSSSYAESQSVMCDKERCITVVGGDTFTSVDATVGTVVKFQLDSASGNADVDWRNQPVKVPNPNPDLESNIFIVKGYDASLGISIYACDILSTSCNGYSTGQIEEGNVSELYVGAYDGNNVAVYWTQMDGGVPSVKKQYLTYSTFSWTSLGDERILSNVGSAAQCITAPAGAQCPAEGIGVASYWEPGSGSSLSATPDADWEYLDTETRTTFLLDGVGDDSDDMDTAMCSGDVCYYATGVDVTGSFVSRNYSNADIFVSVSGGIFTQISANPNLNDYATTGTCPVSDKYIAHGALDGDLYMLRGEVQDYNGGTSPPFTCLTGASPFYDSFALDKYDRVADTWSEIETYTEFTNWSVERTNGREMNCNDERCWIYLVSSNNPGVGDSYVLEVLADDSETLSHPAGTLGSIDMGTIDIIGYAETTDGKYYAISEADLATTSGGDITALVKYRNSAASTPVLIDSNTKTAAYLGLETDIGDLDTVYYAVIPSSFDQDLCFSSTNASTPRPPMFDGANERIEFDIDSEPSTVLCGDVSQEETSCNYLVRRSVSESVNNEYSEEVIRHSTNSDCGSFGSPRGIALAPAYSWSIGGFDGSGDYYATYANSLCSPKVTGSVSCIDFVGDESNLISTGDYWMTEVISESEGVFHPHKVVVPDVNDFSTFPESDDDGSGWTSGMELCQSTDMTETSGSGCRPMSIGDIEYRVTSGPAKAGAVLYKSNNHVTMPQYLQRWIRGVESGKIYMDILGEGVVDALFVQLGCFGGDSSSGLVRVAKSFVSATACPAQLITADIDNDGVDEAMFSEGIYEFASGQELFAFNVNGASSMAPVDFTSDTWMDFVFVTGTSLRTITSEPNIQISFSTELSTGPLLCSSDSSENGKITAVATGITAQNPEDLRFSGTMYGASGAVEDIAFSQSSSTIEFVPRSNGQKSITVVVRDPITAEQESVSCTVNVVGVPVEDTIVETELAKSCSLDPDGEFNYDSSVQGYNWLLGINGRQPIMDGAVATFSVSDIDMIHALDCADIAIEAEVNAEMTETSNTKVFVGAQDDGLDESIGGIWLFRGDLYVATLGQGVACDGSQIFGWSCLEQELDDGGFHVYTMSFERGESTYTISLDGDVIGFADLMNGQFDGKYDAVTVRHLSGTTQIDYVRTAGLTGTADDVRDSELSKKESAAENTLVNCVGASGERDFSANPAGSFTTYENVEEYCIGEGIAQADDSSRVYCDFEDLQEIVEINPRCYQEAFSYCVNVTYPLSSGFESGSEVIASQKVGLQGAAACSLALQAQSSTDSLLKPIWNVAWKYARANAMMVFVLGFLVIVGIAIWAKVR